MSIFSPQKSPDEFLGFQFMQKLIAECLAEFALS